MHLIFSILFPLSVIRLWSDPLGNRLWGGVIWLSAIFCLVYILKKGNGLDLLTKRMKAFPLQTGVALLAISGILLSAIFNLPWIYRHRPLSTLMMVSVLASYSFCIVAFILFYLARSRNFWPLALTIIAGVHVLALLGIPLYPWVKVILGHTLGHNCLLRGKIHAVFRGTTTYGPFAALTAIGLGLSALKTKEQKTLRIAQGATAILATAGCLLCPSRTGLISFFTGFFLSLLLFPRKIRIAGLVLCLVFLAGIHMAAYENQYMRYRLSRSLPYFSKIGRTGTLELKDFKLRINDGRTGLFKRAVALWRTSPWLGIGPGQFNVRSGLRWQLDVHNLYLSILCENGLVTFVPLLWLFLWSIKRFWGTTTSVLLCMLGIIWCFEVLLNHSLPFILGTTWLMAWTSYLQD